MGTTIAPTKGFLPAPINLFRNSGVHTLKKIIRLEPAKSLLDKEDLASMSCLETVWEGLLLLQLHLF